MDGDSQQPRHTDAQYFVVHGDVPGRSGGGLDYSVEEGEAGLHLTPTNAEESRDGARRETTHTGDLLFPRQGQQRLTTLGTERFRNLRRSCSDITLPLHDIDEEGAYTASRRVIQVSE